MISCGILFVGGADMAKFIVECSSPEAEVLLKKRPDISAFVKRLRRLAEENPDAT